jgi:hypothetical protein
MTSTAQLATGIQIRAIDAAALAQLRERDDAGREPRLLTDDEGGSPLRCCLRRSRPGEPIALVSYAPLRRWARQTGADPGPYEQLGPVFIHQEPCEGPADADGPGAYWPGTDRPGADGPVPLMESHRVLRAYSAAGNILGGTLFDPKAAPDASGQARAAQAALSQVLAGPEVALVHVRAVEFGCFLFEVHRA